MTTMRDTLAGMPLSNLLRDHKAANPEMYANEELLQLAREQYAEGSSDDIEIDDSAPISEPADGGTWVAAWVYVRPPAAP